MRSDRLAPIAALALAGCGGSGEPARTPVAEGPTAQPSRTPVAVSPSRTAPPGAEAALAVRPVAGVREERAAHTATALPGGRVLVAGGCVTAAAAPPPRARSCTCPAAASAPARR